MSKFLNKITKLAEILSGISNRTIGEIIIECSTKATIGKKPDHILIDLQKDLISNGVIILTKEMCTGCKEKKDELDARGINYMEIPYDLVREYVEDKLQYKNHVVLPVIFKDGYFLSDGE